jgi:glutathione S-transferase
MLHSLAIIYSRWNAPKNTIKNGDLKTMERGMSVNVQKELDRLEDELSKSQGDFLCRKRVTAADMMVHFSVDFIMRTKLGTQGKEWPEIKRWLEKCTEPEGYRKAVQKT